MGRVLRFFLLLSLFFAVLTLSGCAGPSDQTLYRLPKLPAEYESLETRIDALLSGGAEYAAPTSGSNLQSVQMVDLDGDGVDEAVAILRRQSDERPMKIYIFRADGDNYEQHCLIEGTSNSVYSINYVDLNGDGWREILAGIRGDLDVQNLAVYSVASAKPQQLLVTGYTRYAARDLNGDGAQELIVLHSDEENYAVADEYVWDGAELAPRSSLRLPTTVTELSRLTAGTLSGGENALFVTSVAEENTAVTAILTAADGQLQSVAGKTCRFLELYPGDVNNDGVTEVPEPVAFPQTDPEGAVYYRILWQQFDSKGNSSTVRSTYQDPQGGWTLVLPESWDEGVSVERSSGPDGSSVTFFCEETGGAFLTIYALTGANRTLMANRSGRVLLSRQAEVTYAAELIDGGAGRIDEQGLRDRFGLLAAEWTTGEN